MRRTRFLVVVAVAGAVALAAGLWFGRQAPRATHPLTGRPIAGIATDAAWMDRPEREAEEQPERALDLIGIAPGMVVADVGAGSGYMTMRLARRVGPTGTVYANDIQGALLDILQRKARDQGLNNIKIVLGTPGDARLPDAALDLELLVDVYHEFDHPQAMLGSLRRSLKGDGRLALIEYRKEDPTIPIAETHRLSVADARAEVGAEGFRFDRVIEDLPRQHIIIFGK